MKMTLVVATLTGVQKEDIDLPIVPPLGSILVATLGEEKRAMVVQQVMFDLNAEETPKTFQGIELLVLPGKPASRIIQPR